MTLEGTYLLPAHMIAGLERWVEYGVIPGRFLVAILENRPWMEVLDAADEVNQRALLAWRQWFYVHASRQWYGSPEAVAAWAARGGLRGLAARQEATNGPD